MHTTDRLLDHYGQMADYFSPYDDENAGDDENDGGGVLSSSRPRLK